MGTSPWGNGIPNGHPVPMQASMHLEDYLANLQLKECYLMAPGMEPMLLVQGNKAKSSSVAMLDEPPSNWTRKVWRFRFTYAIPEGRHVPFSATLTCKAGLQVSITPIRHHGPPPRHISELITKLGTASLVPKALGHRAANHIPMGWWRSGWNIPTLIPTLCLAEQHHLREGFGGEGERHLAAT